MHGAPWAGTAVHTGGRQVSPKGRAWKAKWWTTGEEPGTTGQWGVRQDLGACRPPAPARPGACPTDPVGRTPSAFGDRID